MIDDMDRRTFVRGVGTITIAGAVAGCSSGGDGGGGGGDGGSSDGGSDGSADDSGGGGDGGSGGGVPSAVTEYLSDTSNFEGSLADRTGQSEVTVTVGAEGNDGNFAFAPAAIRVDSGTTVVWEWNGEGGQHNVVAEEGADFESELTGEEGFTFEHTFESSGTVTYFCQPHKSLGMKGAVVVG